MDSRDFPLTFDARRQILNILFNCSLEEPPAKDWDGYLDYYRISVESCRVSILTKTHSCICSLVAQLKVPLANRHSVQNALRKRLLSECLEGDDELEDIDEMLEESITLALRLLLMVAAGGVSSGRTITVSGETKLNWKEGTIKDLVSAELSPQISLSGNVKLDKIFNARNLQRIAGVEIRWTNNLADHLRMRDEDKAVEIFHCASFLRLHQTCKIPLPDWQIQTLGTQTCPLLSPTFIDETIRTLALLLPEHDSEVQQWFEKEQTKQQKRQKLLDSLARECGQLKVEERQFENFEYWHDRLVILKQVFDEAEPSNIKQWWHDRRKRVQWYTFWVAAVVLGLTVFFGLVQSVEGALQVYLGFKSA